MKRSEWVNTLYRIAHPILACGASESLRLKMPRLDSANFEDQYLEAIGRVVCGIAPWIELQEVGDEEEMRQRAECRELVIKTLESITRQGSKDYISFTNSSQSLVDAAYLAQGFLRAPSLWAEIGGETQQRLIEGFKSTRKFKPCDNNWLLFSSMVEAFLLSIGEEHDRHRLRHGIESFDLEFYMGDGIYGDGELFCMDYYNSYVIHPMLIDILQSLRHHNHKWAEGYYNRALPRYKRYFEIEERTISPEGTYPVWGRTHICRLGAFHAMSQGVLLGLTPDSLTISQIRGAMDALLDRFVSASGNFLDGDFLSIGISGAQPSMAESYVSMGSAYHCTTFFLCLGLSPASDFWRTEGSAWSSLKAFTGEDIVADHALHDVTMRDTIVRSMRIVLRMVRRRFRV